MLSNGEAARADVAWLCAGTRIKTRNTRGERLRMRRESRRGHVDGLRHRQVRAGAPDGTGARDGAEAARTGYSPIGLRRAADKTMAAPRAAGQDHAEALVRCWTKAGRRPRRRTARHAQYGPRARGRQHLGRPDAIERIVLATGAADASLNACAWTSSPSRRVKPSTLSSMATRLYSPDFPRTKLGQEGHRPGARAVG